MADFSVSTFKRSLTKFYVQVTEKEALCYATHKNWFMSLSASDFMCEFMHIV